MLPASHPAASELSRSLFHIKELLLVGFFVSIGLAGRPDTEAILVAVVLALLLRHAVGADNGLIAEEWLVLLSMAEAISFVLAAVVNGPGQRLIEHLAMRAPRQDPDTLHPEDRPGNAQGAEVIVFGMGRVGHAAYERLHNGYSLDVVGVDSDGVRVSKLAHEPATTTRSARLTRTGRTPRSTCTPAPVSSSRTRWLASPTASRRTLVRPPRTRTDRFWRVPTLRAGTDPNGTYRRV
jgi:hypothetical protein